MGEWRKKEVWVVTVFLKNEDEYGEIFDWCGGDSEEHFANTFEEAREMQRDFLAGNSYYGCLVDDVLISEDMEEREFWEDGELREIS